MRWRHLMVAKWSLIKEEDKLTVQAGHSYILTEICFGDYILLPLRVQYQHGTAICLSNMPPENTKPGVLYYRRPCIS